MRETVDGQRTGISWDFTSELEDIDYEDDLRLLTSRVDHMQEKTTMLEENAGRAGLKLNQQKCKWMNVNSRNTETESERQRGGGSGQFHLPGGASDEGWRRNTGHQEEDSTGICKLQ